MGLAILLIGTRKGLMIARSTDDRRTWAVDDFQFLNQEVYSVALDTRQNPPRIFAGVGPATGGRCSPTRTIWASRGRNRRSRRSGSSGKRRVGRPRLGRFSLRPISSRTSSTRVSSRTRSSDRTTGPELLRSSRASGINPDRPKWTPGGGGACLHTSSRIRPTPMTCWCDVCRGRLPDPGWRCDVEPRQSRNPGGVSPRGSAFSRVRSVRPQGGIPS